MGATNPFESPRKNDYPMPDCAGAGSAMGVRRADESRARSLHLAGRHSQPGLQRPSCLYLLRVLHRPWLLERCQGRHAGDGDSRAQDTGKLEVRPNSRVTKILTNDKGQATGVTYIDEQGNEQEQPAGMVIVSTYVYENVRLLLLSTSNFFKNGLGNNSGNLGKWYMAHSYGGAYGYFPGENFNLFSGTDSQSIAIDNYNGDNFDHTGLGFIRGAISNVSQGESTPIGRLRRSRRVRLVGGASYKKFLKEGVQSITSISTQLEVLPYDANFLDLDPTAKDPIGMPIIRLTFNLYENEKTANAYINGELEKALKAMGADRPGPIPTRPISPSTRTPTAARAWATIPRSRSRTSMARFTSRRTSSCWAGRTGAAPPATTRPKRSTRIPGSQPTILPRTSARSRSNRRLQGATSDKTQARWTLMREEARLPRFLQEERSW